MKKYTYASYGEIEELAGEDFEINVYGRFLIGEQFICLSHKEKDLTISFVLEGMQGDHGYYECIYSDLN